MSDAPSGPLEPRRGFTRTWAGVAVGLVAAVAGLAFILLAPLPGATQAALASPSPRGIIDYRLEQGAIDPATIPAMVAEMGPDRLRASWTRVMVRWATMQPAAPSSEARDWDKDGDGYNDGYVAQLTTVVEQLAAAGVSVILTPVDTPKWASDRGNWEQPPPGYKKNTYYPFYAPDMGNLMVKGQFQALGRFLAGRLGDKARYYECWNEPNQGFYLYPQQPVSATSGGGAIYLKMLKAWYAGVKKGSATAVVIGGATAPRGRGDSTSTPPQAFARYLKANGAASYMDAYSHHPYTPGGSTRVKPGDLPNNPARCVTLGNLGQLTSIFPRLPFYLTEFGYNTQYSRWFGVTVSKADQARYLRQAYSFVKRYPQVKALLWFLVDDWNPTGGADKAGDGVYMGVRTYTGVRKPSWYAFAGGNVLTLAAPGRSKAGAAFVLSGRLTYRSPDGPDTQVLTLQSRGASSSPWKTMATIHTAEDGTYTRKVTQSATRVYRVVWGGVCESPTRTVKTP